MIATRSIELRPETEEDIPFLRQVYAGTREEEMALVPWTPEQKQAFLEMQFRAQYSDYHGRHPDASFDIIVSDGVPAGRLCVHRRADEIRVIDIALLPGHRNQGIGSHLWAELIRESHACGKPLTIHVERNNRALSLYQRLGFRPAGGTGIHLLMQRPAVSDTHTS